MFFGRTSLTGGWDSDVSVFLLLPGEITPLKSFCLSYLLGSGASEIADGLPTLVV